MSAPHKLSYRNAVVVVVDLVLVLVVVAADDERMAMMTMNDLSNYDRCPRFQDTCDEASIRASHRAANEYDEWREMRWIPAAAGTVPVPRRR